mgnify:CR=1 FL=1
MRENKTILQVSQLTKKFNDFTAVDSVDFSLIEGEIFGFLGPNGAGKTTTINMLTGLARPTSGKIFYLGKDYTANIKQAQPLLGIVPDESNLYEELDGFENLCFCAALYDIPKSEREKRAQNLLEQFGLADAGKKHFKVYSKGMKRKLTVAAGIIHHPEILFLDEPTTGIDVASARQIRELIHQLNSDGTTIFMTTHYIEEAERLCHRIAFIVSGKIVCSGSVPELMQQVQQDHILQFSFAGSIDVLKITRDFEQQFAGCALSLLNGNMLRVQSQQPTPLMPLMQFFDQRRMNVLEAKIINPSLEEVFVKLTGVEPTEMKKDEERRKK